MRVRNRPGPAAAATGALIAPTRGADHAGQRCTAPKTVLTALNVTDTAWPVLP